MTKPPKLPDEILQFFRATGRAGGIKRAANMTAEERSEQARKAVQARWAKVKESSRKTSGKKQRSGSKESQ
jgi:hypothetical protein